MKNTRKTTPAQAIKKELKKVFPAVKFSCRYSTFAWGDSVDVYWTDGPTEAEVEKYTKKYQNWSFDGMTDMYSYTNSRDDIPQAKYVQCSRSMSENVRKVVNAWAEKAYRPEYDRDRYLSPVNMWYHLFRVSPLVSSDVEIIEKWIDHVHWIEGQYQLVNI